MQIRMPAAASTGTFAGKQNFSYETLLYWTQTRRESIFGVFDLYCFLRRYQAAIIPLHFGVILLWILAVAFDASPTYT